ncbi:MAG: FecR domain-containing protein [Pirellulales bacterium]|nr:FecR domain-containing protein [Pirellulales bacterium]
MTAPWTSDRLLEAVGQLCNGTLPESEGRQLDELLRDDPQARRLYTNYMWVHACLYAEGGSLVADSATPASERPATSPDYGQRLDLASGPPAAQALRSRAWWVALAATILGVAAFSSWLTYRLTDGRRLAHSPGAAPASRGSDPAASSPAAVVARITGTHNCLWRDPHTALGYGSSLAAGQRIELAEGLAEITFNDGAAVLLEGPATFDVNASDKVGLRAGRLAAVVPQRARGFRIHTAALDLFEAGTEFGLIARESGAAEVHVFSGLVKADVLDAAGRAFRRIELNAAEAARITPLATTIAEFPADDAQFVRNIMPPVGPHDGLLADEAFRYPEGPLEAQNGGFGWAGPWFTTSAEDEAGPDSNSVKAGSLAVQGVVPVGNRACIAGHYNRIRRQLATSVGGVFDAEGLVENQDDVRLIGRDGKRVYVSFLQQVSQAGDGFYGVELHRGDGNGNRVLCIGNGAEGAGYGATSNVNIYGPKNFPALGEETSETSLLVIKISFGVDNRDTVEVFRNPRSLRDEAACQADAILRGNFAFDRISLANFDGRKTHEVDEIRVGTHFLAVTGRWGNNQGRLQRQIARRPDRQGMSVQLSVVRCPLLTAICTSKPNNSSRPPTLTYDL